MTEQPNKGIPVYRVRPESGTEEKMLHRNMLLPLCLPWPRELEREAIDEDDVERESVDGSDDVDSEFEVQMEMPRPRRYDDNHVHLQVDNVNDADDNVDVSVVEDSYPQAATDETSHDEQVATVASPGPVSPGSSGTKSTPRADTPPLRRSTRVRNPPCRLGDFVSHAQTAHLLDWQIKVAALMQLLPLFPLQHAEIGNAIMYVITHA